MADGTYKTTHTPGPWGWTYDGSSDYSVGPADDPQVNPVAHVHSRNPAVGAANCSLIAAAPDLLAALIDMIDGDEHIFEARAAIAKAIGE